MSYEIGRLVGASFGLIFGLVLVVIIFKFGNKNHALKNEYDERQKVVRGRGYMIGFWATSICLILQMFIGFAEYTLPVVPGVMPFTSFVIGGTIACCYNIWNGAYWGLNNKKSRYVAIFVVCTLVNFMGSIGAMIEGQMVVDGVLQSIFVNFLCGLMFLALAITAAIRMIVDKKQEEED